MEKATVSRLKDNLSAYLRRVRAGHAVVIYDRDVPIARLERIEATGRGSDRLALLRSQGLTRPPRVSLSAPRLRAMLGASEPYAEMPWLWTDQYDANIQALGFFDADLEPVLRAMLGASLPSSARLLEALRADRSEDR